jgi:phosphatidylinositol alpha-mannosyltransferase
MNMKKSIKKPLKNTNKNRLKIGFLLDDTLDTPDGIQQYIQTLGSWLSKQGHEVHYLVGETKRNDIKNIHSMARNVKVKFNKNRLSMPLPTNKQLIRLKLKELDLDVIHVQMPHSPLFAGRVIKMASSKTRIIGTFHIVPANRWHYLGGQALKILSHHSLKQFDKIICVSTAAADFARKAFGLESIIITNTIKLKTMRHKPIYNKTLTIVFLGRLVERKGCLLLLKALLQLQKQYKGKYQVLIGGKGPLRPKLEEYISKHKIKNVKFLGFIEEKDKPTLLASGDIAIFPSTGGESFGIILIEAMAAGARVVLGGDNVGYRTVLGDNPDLLVDPYDCANFANRLQYFLEDKLARQSAAEWNKQNIAQYDVENIGPRVLSVYRKS